MQDAAGNHWILLLIIPSVEHYFQYGDVYVALYRTPVAWNSNITHYYQYGRGSDAQGVEHRVNPAKSHVLCLPSTWSAVLHSIPMASECIQLHYNSTLCEVLSAMAELMLSILSLLAAFRQPLNLGWCVTHCPTVLFSEGVCLGNLQLSK